MDKAINESVSECEQKTGAMDPYLTWRPSIAEIGLGAAAAGISGISAYLQTIPFAIAIPLILLSFIIGVMIVRIVKVPALGHSIGTEYAVPWAHVGAVVLLTMAMVALVRTAPADKAHATSVPRFYRNKPIATREELKSLILTNKAIYVADIPLINGAIRGKTFSDCHIIGPAILAPGNRFQMIGIGIPNPTDEGPFFIVDTPHPVREGVVRVENSLFSGCNLENIGFVGSTKVIDYVKGRLRPSQ